MLLGRCEIFNYKNGGGAEKIRSYGVKLWLRADWLHSYWWFFLGILQNKEQYGITPPWSVSIVSDIWSSWARMKNSKDVLKKIMLKKSLSSSTSNKRQKSVLKVEKLIQKKPCVFLADTYEYPCRCYRVYTLFWESPCVICGRGL